MRLLIISGLSLVLFSILLKIPTPTTKNPVEEIRLKKLSTPGCTPDWTTYELTKEQILSTGPLPGTGKYHWKISTENDSAQFYFDQAMNLYYGFHIIEAIPSIKKAQTFDAAHPMLYWAEALLYGPNINDVGYATSAAAIKAVSNAKKYSSVSNEMERHLIDAMTLRYSADSSIEQSVLNEKYAEAMRSIFQLYPQDARIGTLCADALMLLHPWDLWTSNGEARPWTKEILETLEKTLKTDPKHPGANHYYIHAMEASATPWKAKKSADILGTLTPGLAHMVHMPSHIYIRTGDYQKGREVNLAALEQYKKYLLLMPDVVNNAALYDFHNRHMLAACAINGTDYQLAMKESLECRNSLDSVAFSWPAPFSSYIQYMYMTPEVAMVRFEKWKEILAEPEVPANLKYATLLQQFAKGLANVRMKQTTQARESLKKLDSVIGDPELALPFGAFSPAKAGADIARLLLLGSIAEQEGKRVQAIQYFEEAVKAEDALVYNEPRDWLLPARQFLGYALIRANQKTEARKVFTEELKINPKNPVSIKGLNMTK